MRAQIFILLTLFSLLLGQCRNEGSEPNNPRAEVAFQSVFDLSDIGLETDRIVSMISYEAYVILQTAEDRFIKLDTETRIAEQITQVSGLVTDFTVSPNGQLYVGTEQEGVYAYSLSGVEVLHLDTLNSCMPTNSVTAIAVNAAGSIYLGCLSLPRNEDTIDEFFEGYGLIRMDQSGASCAVWTTADYPLQGDFIQALAIADDEQVWTATGDRLSPIWNEIYGEAGIVSLRGDTISQSFSGNEDFNITRITDLQVGPSGRVWFKLYYYVPQGEGFAAPTYEIKLDGEISRVGTLYRQVASHIDEFRSGERLAYVVGEEPIDEWRYQAVPFLWRTTVDMEIDYPVGSEHTHYRYGMSITSADRCFLAHAQGVDEAVFD